MKSLIGRLRNRLFKGLARQSDLAALYDHISGLLQIQNAMAGKPILRPLRGWAMSPDAMVLILADLQERTEPTVVEFGSGQSTLILAAALKHRSGRLFTVDHYSEYSTVIQRQIAACGLSERVQFLHAPLGDAVEGGSIRSYDLTGLPNVRVDVALVDGPPFTNVTLTRLIPLRWAARHLNSGGAIFLDDSARDGEKACLRHLASEFPHLRQVSHVAEKGLVELREAETGVPCL